MSRPSFSFCLNATFSFGEQWRQKRINSSCPLFFVQTLQKRYFFSKNVTEEKINRGKKTVENEEGKNLNRIAQKKSL